MPQRRRKSTKRRSHKVSGTSLLKSVQKAEARRKYPGSQLFYDRASGAYFPKHTEATLKTFGESFGSADYAQKRARQNSGYKGLGDYSSSWSKYRKYIPRALGAGYGMYRGGLGGATKGWGAGAGVSKYMGWGDYNSGGNTDYGQPVENQIMPGGGTIMSVNSDPSNRTGDIIFEHTEFIQNVTSSTTTFDLKAFPINAGLAESFPFLSQLARNFTMYELQGLIFEYRPTSGEFGNTTNALGKVIMATNYDPDADPFVESVNMSNYDYATSCKPSVMMRHGVECAPSQSATKMQYIRTEAATRDKIFTDIGLFQIATEGIPFTGTLGELWVTYKVKLSRSRIFREPNTLPTAYFAYERGDLTSLITAAKPLGNIPKISGPDNIAIEPTWGGINVGASINGPTLAPVGSVWNVCVRYRTYHTATSVEVPVWTSSSDVNTGSIFPAPVSASNQWNNNVYDLILNYKIEVISLGTPWALQGFDTATLFDNNFTDMEIQVFVYRAA